MARITGLAYRNETRGETQSGMRGRASPPILETPIRGAIGDLAEHWGNAAQVQARSCTELSKLKFIKLAIKTMITLAYLYTDSRRIVLNSMPSRILYIIQAALVQRYMCTPVHVYCSYVNSIQQFFCDLANFYLSLTVLFSHCAIP